MPGIAVSSSPWRLWLQCLTLCRVRLCPPGPARRQQARLQVGQEEVTRKNQTRAGPPPRECEWNPAEAAVEGARAGTQRPEGQARGAAGWGAALAAGEQAAPGRGPWENVATLAPREPALPCRQSAVRTAQLQRLTPPKALSAQCWEGEPGTPAPPAPGPSAALPSTPSPCRVLVFADVREVAFPSEFGPGPSLLYVALRPWPVSLRGERLTAHRFSRVPGAGQSRSSQRGPGRVEPPSLSRAPVTCLGLCS